METTEYVRVYSVMSDVLSRMLSAGAITPPAYELINLALKITLKIQYGNGTEAEIQIRTKQLEQLLYKLGKL